MKMNYQNIVPPVSVSVPHAAVLLGVSTRTVWALVRDGTLPALHIGQRVLCKYSSLIEFVDSRADTSGALVKPKASENIRRINAARTASQHPEALNPATNGQKAAQI